MELDFSVLGELWRKWGDYWGVFKWMIVAFMEL